MFPKAIEKLDLSGYDIIISSSHAVAKGIKIKAGQLHITYCHSPMRYAWDQADQYLVGVKGFIAKVFINYLRKWDLKSASNVDFFIANSHHIAEKIKRIYIRNSEVIYPLVDVDKFGVSENKESYYLTASRMVPYKRNDLIIDAFNSMPDKKLVVIGKGPELKKIKSIAKENILVMGYQSPEVLKNYMQKAKAFVFAAEEDFGMLLAISQFVTEYNITQQGKVNYVLFNPGIILLLLIDVFTCILLIFAEGIVDENYNFIIFNF